MTELESLLATVLPELVSADTALHGGDASARVAMWSHDDPVTLFGAAVTKSGWRDISETFTWLAGRFSDCSAFDYEVIAAGVSGDLAYIAGIERTTASVAGAAPESYALRVTTVLRREAGQWRVVHRHGDPYDAAAGQAVSRL